MTNAGAPLSTDFESPQSIPYFLGDEPMTSAEFRQRLHSGSRPGILSQIELGDDLIPPGGCHRKSCGVILPT